MRTLVAVALVALATSYLTVAREERRPDATAAESFLAAYVADALRDPRSSYRLLGEGYRAEKRREDRSFDYDAYRDDLRRYLRIRVSEVRLSERYDGWYAADVTYVPRTGTASTSAQAFLLSCPSWTGDLALRCPESDIRIERVRRETGYGAAPAPAREPRTAGCERLRGACRTELRVEVLADEEEVATGLRRVTLGLTNTGDHPTRGCAVVDAAGELVPFALRAGADDELQVRLEPAASDLDEGEAPSAVEVRVECRNVADLPTELAIDASG